MTVNLKAMNSLSCLIFSLLTCFLVFGCSSANKKSEHSEEMNAENNAKFNQAYEALGQENYKEAAQLFDQFLISNPTTEFDLIVLYNSGAAYEGLGNCQKAGQRYRQASLTAQNKFPRIAAQSMYRLSFAYECIGKPDKMVASLRDAWKRRSHLPDEVARAELPARLAIAYAQMGNKKMAFEFFSYAQQGIGFLQNKLKNLGRRISNLAQTLFIMGQVNTQESGIAGRKKIPPDAYLRSLLLQQEYLLQAVELNEEIWSEKARDELILAYQKVWEYIDQVSAPGDLAPEAAEIKKSQVQVEIAEKALFNLQKLTTMKLPGVQRQPLVTSLLDSIRSEEQKFQAFVASNASITPLSKEGQKLEGLKREGRVKSSPTVLEKKGEAKTNE